MAIVSLDKTSSPHRHDKEGYIGVSRLIIEERFKKHVHDATIKNRRTYTLHNAIRKYGKDAFVLETLLIGEEEYCYFIENKLRPTKGIGYNVAEGGFSPPAPDGRKLSEETKQRISEAALKKKRTTHTRRTCRKVQRDDG